MTSIEKIYTMVEEQLRQAKEVTTQDVEQLTGMKRSLVSLYLNQLVTEGRLLKTTTRPVKFYLPQSKEDAFSSFVGYNGSIQTQIDQCKSAVTYPPDGLPILLHGSSGVGKSYLAKLVHQYASEKGVISKQAPLVVLNCADYANNKELLSSVLFGYTKGAFSGAEMDTTGLISEAEGGYLFLDEVHNLSAENQEKLFLLIDEKKYRPLGVNTEWKKANIRLIMATTEDPESALLVTFKRRIPFDVFLPDFRDRAFVEREMLIVNFLKQESRHLQVSLEVGESYIRELVESNYKGNIGEIRNRIKADCAEAYNKEMTETNLVIGKAPFTFINAESALKTNQGRKESHYFKEFGFIGFTEAKSKLKTLVDQLHDEWVLQQFTLSSIDVPNGTERFFAKKAELLDYLKKYGIQIDVQTVEKIILLAILVQYDSSTANVTLKDISEARYNFHKYFQLSQGILAKLFVTHTPSNETIMNLLAIYLSEIIQIKAKVKALVIMHGKNNAFSLASAANQLIGDFIFESFDMPIDLAIGDLIKEVNQFIKQYNTSDGLILLVDMGSLEQMYKRIQENVTGDLLIMNNVSTYLALDVGLKLSQGQNINQIEQLKLDDFTVSKQYYAGVSQKTNILISCISGEGIALKVTDIISKYIVSEEIELLSMDYTRLQELLQKDQKVIFKDTIAILTTSNIEEAVVPVINIENIINGASNLTVLEPFFASTETIKKCTNEIIKLFTLEGATERLSFLNPTMVINEVEEVIEMYEAYYKINIANFMRINLFLHLSTMIERILLGDGIEESEMVIEDMAAYEGFKELSHYFFKKIEKKYKITILEGEMKMIYLILREQLNLC